MTKCVCVVVVGRGMVDLVVGLVVEGVEGLVEGLVVGLWDR